jgi:ribulose-phosphate 3-epimerase
MTATVRILPSILSADFARLGDDVARMEAGGADWLHVDVMDGQFVPNLTFGAKVIEAVRSVTTLPLDVHMMVWQPEKYFDDFAAAGASRMLIHAEATPHVHRHVHRIKELGCAAGVAINPGTPVEVLLDIAADLDTVLVMTVNPGFGGQQFIAHTVEKICRARELLTRARSRAVLEVDGGINRETIATCFRAGADSFVAGHAVFAAADPKAEIGELRRRAVEVVT